MAAVVGNMRSPRRSTRPSDFCGTNVDRDGKVLLTASSQLLRTHVVFRLDTDSQEKLSALPVRVERGWLAGAPMVNVAGYAFLVQTDKRELPKSVHTEALKLGPLGTEGRSHPGTCL